MMTKIMISISNDFSRTPAGRYHSDGPFSGQKFREEFLIPKLKAGSEIEVDLDGELGYGSSFLEEAFGGLIRAGFKVADLKARLIVISTLNVYKDRVWRYIDEASARPS